MLNYSPAVFAVDKNYQIIVYKEEQSTVAIKIADEIYYDDSNGILRSRSFVHKIEVPMEKLNNAGEYTVLVREIIERKPYFTETRDLESYVFKFYPVPDENPRAYHISDTHNLIYEPVFASEIFGKIDFLVMNGDIPDHSGALENCKNVYVISDKITHGNIPIVFARGNHDMRGIFAEAFSDQTPTHMGKTYYTFRLGAIWGMILDCGEDKIDDSDEYGHTICCHNFRKKETEFIKDVISRANDEYKNDGVKWKMVISHIPFTHIQHPPFDIEKDTYTMWADMVKEHIKPDIYLHGHLHVAAIHKPDSDFDHRGQCSSAVIGSGLDRKTRLYTGCGLDFADDGIYATFTTSIGERSEKQLI